ncbi:hypothetical protein HY29_14310 [Hyphomonas beringensis]|uniref:Yip1 domain-containing protein n=1 Tax=Hyphomonas beringensis TaxID=1280946 RepID=A0A062U9L4_9PROT|nr:hypothetical protein [Hyphomonas beringensis]KCZ54428.1 hypothetical protein HY29_14310 [Hyphomonas beringensis]
MSDFHAPKPDQTDSSRQPDLDDMMEDVFGLNIRAGKTVWDLFRRPAKVFSAARTPDWMNGAYTPSFRVYFSLIAILFLFKFFWASDNSMMQIAFETTAEGLRELDTRLDLDDMVDDMMEKNWLIYPFAVGFWYTLTALLMRIWGKGTPTITRIRLFFAAIIPSTTLLTIMMITTAKLPFSLMMIIASGSLLVAFLFDSLTTWRGLKSVHTKGARLWRALLLGFATSIVGILAPTTASTVAGFWVGQDVGRTLDELHEQETATATEIPGEPAPITEPE